MGAAPLSARRVGRLPAAYTSFLIAGDRTSDLAGQLERLAALHANGRLSDAEFTAAKVITLEREHDGADQEFHAHAGDGDLPSRRSTQASIERHRDESKRPAARPKG
jgi:hypothetical protein